MHLRDRRKLIEGGTSNGASPFHAPADSYNWLDGNHTKWVPGEKDKATGKRKRGRFEAVPRNEVACRMYDAVTKAGFRCFIEEPLYFSKDSIGFDLRANDGSDKVEFHVRVVDDKYLQFREVFISKDKQGQGIAGKLIDAVLSAIDPSWQVEVHVNLNGPFWRHIREKHPDFRWTGIAEESLKEEYLEGDNPCWAFTSPYEAKSLLSRNDRAYRILYDGKHKLCLVGDANEVIHRDMLEKAIDEGFLTGLRPWELDNYIDDELEKGRMVYAIYCPERLVKQTYGTAIGEDGYDELYEYDGFVISTRESEWKRCPLAKAFGNYRKHLIADGWVDDYTRKVSEVESLREKLTMMDAEDIITKEMLSGDSPFFYDDIGYITDSYEYIERGFILSHGEMLDTYGENHWGVESAIQDFVYGSGDKELSNMFYSRRSRRIMHYCTDALGWIRVNGYNEDFICLPSEMPSNAQFDSLTKWIDDYFMHGHDELIVTDADGMNAVNYPDDCDGRYIVRRIKSMYATGDLREELLTEKTRQELVAKSRAGRNYRSKDRQNQNRWDRRKYSQVANSIRDYNNINMDVFFKDDILEFVIKVHGETDDYEVTVTFSNILKRLQQEIKNNNNKLEFKCVLRSLLDAFNSDDVYVSCTCPDFVYAGFNHYGVKQQYNSKPIMGKALDAPRIKNPNDDLGSCCKHINLCLANTDWMMKVASVINNYIKWTKEHMSRNYADIIFPAVYGMKYDKAIQLSLFDDPNDNGLLPTDQETITKVIDRTMSNRGAGGRWAKGNEYRFQKQDTTRQQQHPEDAPGQMHLDLERPDTTRKSIKLPDEEDEG